MREPKLAELDSTGEQRIVSVLSVDMIGSTMQIVGLDPDDAIELFDEVRRLVDRAVTRAGGYLESFRGDGGIAVFGWPEAQEDHADRACRAAWQIQSGREKINAAAEADRFNLRVGVHTGLVGFRQIALPSGPTLDLVGDTVHIAKTLEKHAPANTVVVSGRTVALCSTRPKLSPLSVPGLPGGDAFPIFVLGADPGRVGSRVCTSRHSLALPIFGRARETKALSDVLTGVGDPTLAIVGEPGIGKSRHIIMLQEQASDLGIVVWAVDCVPGMSTAPHGVMRGLVEEMVGSETEPDGNDAAIRLARGGVDGPLARYTADALLSADQADLGNKIPRRSQEAAVGGALEARVSAALAGFLKERTRLVVVENIHNADPDSLHGLYHLASHAGPHLKVVVTGRPEARQAAMRIAGQIVDLKPLSARAVQEFSGALAEHLCLSTGIPPEAIARADGNPLLLEQHALAIATAGAEAVRKIPQRFESLIHARLAQLPPGPQELARLAGVLGETTDAELLREAIGRSPDQFREELEILGEIAILDGTPDARVRFRHALIGEAAATTVPRRRRRTVHKAMVDAIRRRGRDARKMNAILAHHAEEAGDDTLALECLWLEARRAKQRLGSRSLVRIFHRAVSCAKRIGESADERYVDFILISLASMIQLGEIETIKAHLPKVRELAIVQMRPKRICGANCMMGLLDWFEGQFRRGISTSTKALEEAQRLGSRRLQFASRFNIASMQFGIGDVDAAIRSGRQICQSLDADPSRDQLGAVAEPAALTRVYLAHFMLAKGRLRQAEHVAREAVDIARAANDSYATNLSLSALGRTLLDQKRFGEALAELSVSLNMVDENGYDAHFAHAVGMYCLAIAGSGKIVEAVRTARSALDDQRLRRTGETEKLNCFSDIADVLHCGNDLDARDSALDEGMVISREIDSPVHSLRVLSARLHFMSDDGADKTEIAGMRSRVAGITERFGIVPPPVYLGGYDPERVENLAL